MDSQTRSGFRASELQRFTFAPRTAESVACNGAASCPKAFDDVDDSQQTDRSFEMRGEDGERAQETITVRTTVPRTTCVTSSSPLSRREQRSAAVHVDPHRSRTVAAAAAAKEEEEKEAAAEPLTAENETWRHWGFRHTWNGFVMMLLGLYQVVQVGVRRQPADVETITNTTNAYMSAPPRADELEKKAGGLGSAETVPL
ncbi:hypothetical protein ABB37_05185 [Leptomonas pyrrhocoris]|uniref:Uncharacterized protein n=1 Tax=Leptomonas pyrrhocoris TaxID=157538 RepID=A0A0N0VFB0_LEPPY|nr:hypothetical protein ABB37_05185 [Leptomonas pyrrhocoris]XP_015658647.1 hypothetical protein ABB37_05185 [Leptomonas pyrrhocoris]KPA80207.1 hypothetical protein ABB37_05185 [Leptomonas pyrrhocoris]KPA80208.1 hypothetical protein ABB37_05185 [Leptomonas pyrrhocoris]|eukprot:XP_015658646.1 hypothetical protein ABB37_05185 [Leptomonas pyrrhocoris]